jgi:hypothetical protein
MTWNAEQERVLRHAQWMQQTAVRDVCAAFLKHVAVTLSNQQAADIILRADALIALLRPFASEPAVPEPAAAAATGDAEGWIANTGEAPVLDGIAVDIRQRNEMEFLGCESSNLDWEITAVGGDITHWRLHKPQESKA